VAVAAEQQGKQPVLDRVVVQVDLELHHHFQYHQELVT